MAENAARADWAGVGVRLPWPLLSPLTLRLAARRALATASLEIVSAQLAAWARLNDGAVRAADLVQRLALEQRRGLA
jgi:UDP:flavonoid glycosyltransferase YjiC (YdhE family)